MFLRNISLKKLFHIDTYIHTSFTDSAFVKMDFMSSRTFISAFIRLQFSLFTDQVACILLRSLQIIPVQIKLVLCEICFCNRFA